jgi:acyl carrier protein
MSRLEEIKAVLRAIFVDTLRLPRDSTRIEEGNLIEHFGIDSIGLMEIITRVEHEFQIIIEEEESFPTLLHSFDMLATYIARKKKETLP